ncbi:phage N-6-adenine-methyltransferase [Escherichia coli]|uniref:phage N-6-adenine-methyltransferase n=2 Tax=Enterobacterales TaxID=91347 RepID=UPI00201CC0BB|nr:phage N-6-adenine-methyltransferase [Escherichia coli]
MNLRYGSVCSGLEAASQAWEPLGWTPAWFAEIEPFPSAVLAHHWPHVQNLGDMTKIAAAITAGDVEAPDVLVGGTPCQAFSVAGRRAGLDDARGQLTLSYVELADAIDNKRRERGEQPVIIVWENVPGVLSSKDNAFGCFLAELAGESSELQPAGGKWTYAGCVSGPKRVIAWRTIDAQFCGVAQRRRRTFVVASAHPDIDPTEILFELDSLRRDTPPSRETGSCVTSLTANGVGVSGADDNQGAAGHLIPSVVGALDTECGFSKATDQSLRNGHMLPVNVPNFYEAYQHHGWRDADCAGPLTANLEKGVMGGTPLVSHDVTAFNWQAAGNTSSTLGADEHCTGTLQASQHPAVAYSVALRGRDGGAIAELGNDIAGTLRASAGGGDKPHVLAFSSKDYGADASVDVSPTLRASNSANSNQNAGAPPAIAYAIAGNTIGRSPENGGNGTGYSIETGYTLTKPDQHGVMHDMKVRRLMPVECERLQGMADNFTQIPWKNKPANECPDGPRYKAIGNSMAVPVMRWIGERIQAAMESIENVPALNPYCAALAAQRVESEHYLKDVGDQWRTPESLFWGINAMFGPITLDLFADADNAKCDAYYTAEDNALTQDWSERLKELGGAAYANPPYSRAKEYEGQYVTGMRHIIDHAMAMREKGGRYIFLIKAATSEVWWPEEADHVAFIRGRIGFDLPVWFKPADEKQKPTGAFFAGAVVILDKQWRGPAISYVTRDDLITRGDAFLAQVRRMAEKLVAA